jgi:anhydro-N-acetylmuramic acid kinase
LFVGLISGTSINSIDTVLVDLSPAQTRLLQTHEHPIPADIRNAIVSLCQPGRTSFDALDRMAQLDSSLARLFADAVHCLLNKAELTADDIVAVGSHGQTVRHAPDSKEPYTVQLGNPSLLAELTGIQIVADFRRRDMAAGGQGAPLAPAFHAAFLHDPTMLQAVVNIGGIANITILPADIDAVVSGFDTGPGNTLLDNWAARHRSTAMDAGGSWAASGQVLNDLLTLLLQDDYFQRSPPKSTGREYFHLDWLQHYLSAWGNPAREQDIQATLVALTAHSIARAIQTHADAVQRVLVCGGGSNNPVLMKALQNRLAPIPVLSTTVRGIDADYLEAMGFAWLAQRTLARLPGNLPAVTGARGPRVLGAIYPA